MKIFIIMGALLLSGCSLLFNYQPVEYGLTPLFDSIQSAMEWETNEITYKSDPANYGKEDYWASPKETLDRKCGDCEDFSILLMYMIYTSFGGKADLVCTSDHAIVKYAGKYYEPQGAVSYDSYPGIIKTYSFDYVMNVVKN